MLGVPTSIDLPVALHSVQKLNAGDEVYLYKNEGGMLYEDATPDTHFSVWLVDEKLNNLLLFL